MFCPEIFTTAAATISFDSPLGRVESTYFAYKISPGIDTRRLLIVSPESAMYTLPLKIPLYTPVSTTGISNPSVDVSDQTKIENLSAKFGYSFLFMSLSFTIISTKEFDETICFFHSIVPRFVSSAYANESNRDEDSIIISKIFIRKICLFLLIKKPLVTTSAKSKYEKMPNIG